MPNNLIFNKESIKNLQNVKVTLGGHSARASWAALLIGLHHLHPCDHRNPRIFMVAGGSSWASQSLKTTPSCHQLCPQSHHPVCLFHQQNNPNVQLNSVWLRHDWKSSWFYLDSTWDLFLKIGLMRNILIFASGYLDKWHFSALNNL